MSNVVPFAPREPNPEPLAYNPGVVRSTAATRFTSHAWNTLFALGWSEQGRQEPRP